MRMTRLTTWLVLGTAVALAYGARKGWRARRQRAREVDADLVPDGTARREPNVVPRPIDIGQLAKGFDEAGELHIEAFPDASAAWDSETDASDDPQWESDSGELYDLHMPRAVDRELPDDDQAQSAGMHWFEHLEASAAEFGPEPEYSIDVVDDSDPHAGHHKTDRRDTPVADRGSAGPRGL